MKKRIFIFSILSLYATEHQIQINGLNLTLLEHVEHAKQNPTHFKYLDFLRFSVNGGYSRVAELREDDLSDIRNSNFVYSRYYAAGKRKNDSTEVGAVILGSKDSQHISAIMLARVMN